jgi:hypothetical protein
VAVVTAQNIPALTEITYDYQWDKEVCGVAIARWLYVVCLMQGAMAMSGLGACKQNRENQFENMRTCATRRAAQCSKHQ